MKSKDGSMNNCEHPKDKQIWIPEEEDVNVRENLICGICNKNLRLPQPDDEL